MSPTNAIRKTLFSFSAKSFALSAGKPFTGKLEVELLEILTVLDIRAGPEKFTWDAPYRKAPPAAPTNPAVTSKKKTKNRLRIVKIRVPCQFPKPRILFSVFYLHN